MPNDATNDGQSGADLTQLDGGTPVYDVNGQPIGTLDVAKTGDYLVVNTPGGREL